MTETIGIGPTAAIIAYGLIVIAAVLTCVLSGTVWPLPLFLAGALLIASTTRFRLVVDRRGVRVLSVGGALIEYDANEITAARTREVNPFTEFGGWGLRMRSRRHYGLVARRGPGFTIELASGDSLTVTTRRADAFAATLNTLADRQHRG